MMFVTLRYLCASSLKFGDRLRKVITIGLMVASKSILTPRLIALSSTSLIGASFCCGLPVANIAAV